MKLLVVTYSYAPDLTPRAFRWTALVQEMARRGHEVHVLCASSKEDKTPQAEGVTVFRVRDWLLNASSRVSVGAAAMKPVAGHTLSSRAKGQIRKSIRSMWRSLYWPDYSCGWVIPALLKARQLRTEHRYDYVISVSHPFSGHVIGLFLRRYFRNSGWMVDIGDPFALMKEPTVNNPHLYSKVNRLIERYVLQLADSISVTTTSTLQLYEKHFPMSIGKVQVMPPLLSLPVASAKKRIGQPSAVKLVFVGTLYRGLRNPQQLLQHLSKVLLDEPTVRLELHFYGAINDCAEVLDKCSPLLKACVFLHGLVAREDIVSAMTEADVLVNIGNESVTQLASKVIEYMAMGKPILNFISIEQDTSLVALAQYPSVLTLRCAKGEPSKEAVNAIARFIRQPPKVPIGIVDEVHKRYSLDYVADLYVSALEGKSNV